jgi:ABC-type glycerol-3-phosphate transport system substrate-binding protein
MTAEKRDEQFNNGRIGIASTNDALNGSRDHHRAFREINPEGGYMTIYPPIREGLDRDKVYASSYALVGWNVTTITRSAEEPERIYEFLDWLTGPEGQAVSLYGPPGRYWESWKQYRGVDVVDLETPLFMERDEEAYAEMLDSWHFNWVPNGAWQHAMSRYEYDLFPPGPDEWKNLDYAAITRSHAIATDEYAGILPDPTSDAGIIYSSADEIVNKQTLRAILADSEAEARAAIEEARAQLSQIGFAGALAEINENWKGRLELMNM